MPFLGDMLVSFQGTSSFMAHFPASYVSLIPECNDILNKNQAVTQTAAHRFEAPDWQMPKALPTSAESRNPMVRFESRSLKKNVYTVHPQSST